MPRKRKKPKAPKSWAKQEAHARRELERSARQIEGTAQGTPSGAASGWRRGKSPSSNRPVI